MLLPTPKGVNLSPFSRGEIAGGVRNGLVMLSRHQNHPMRCTLSRPRLGFAASVSLLLALVGFVYSAAAAPAPSPTDPLPADPFPQRQLTDDVVTPLVPEAERSDAEKLALRAVSHFATGRLYERRGDLAKALRYYQRAARYDSSAPAVLRRVVEVAQRLDRYHEAARYAVLLSEQDASDELSLLRALLYLSSTDQDKRSLAIYESALDAQAEPRGVIWFELHKLAGSIYHRQQQPQRAAAAFTKVRRALSDPAALGLDAKTAKLSDEAARALHLIMSDAFLAAGDLDAAMETLQQAEKHQADSAYVAFAKARILLKQGDTKSALETLQTYLASDSQEAGAEAYRLLGEILAAQDQSSDFIGRLERLADKHPDNVSLGTFLAEQLAQAGRAADARKLYEELMARQPNLEGYRALVRIYRQANEVDRLLMLLGSLAEQADTLQPLGDELQAIIDDNETRRSLAAEARKLDKQAIERAFAPWLAMGMLASEAQQFDIAKEFYERIINSDHPEKRAVLVRWALDLLMASKYAEASDLFQRGLDEEMFAGNTSAVNYYLSGALAMQDRFDEAVAAARRAADEEPDSADSLSRLAWVLSRAGLTDQAREAYESLIVKHDIDNESLDSREIARDARISLSHLLTQEDEIAEGAELLEQVLDEFPEHVGAKNDLAYLWAEEDINLVLAEILSRAAVAKEPENPAYLDTLGWVFFRLEKYEEAVAELRRAVKLLDTPDGVVLDHLGDALHKTGQDVAAMQHWKRAVAAFNKSSDAENKKRVQEKIVKYTEDN